MTDRDERLEAVAKAAQWRSPYNYSPQMRAMDFIAMYDAIRAFDEQQRKEVMPHDVSGLLNATASAVTPVGADPPTNRNICVHGRSLRDDCERCAESYGDGRMPADNPLGISGPKVTPAKPTPTDKPVGADPPWLAEAAKIASNCYYGFGPSGHCEGWPEVVRAVLDFAADQPPSEQAIEKSAAILWEEIITDGRVRFSELNAIDCVKTKEQAKSILIAAAKARSGR
jgi:hypothetical protein